MLETLNMLKEKLDAEIAAGYPYDLILKRSREIDKALMDYYKAHYSNNHGLRLIK